MKLPSLIGHASELRRIIWKSSQPADGLASEYFRSKKYIGSKERKFLSECVFASLRLHGLIEYIINTKKIQWGESTHIAISILIATKNGIYDVSELLKPMLGADCNDDIFLNTLAQAIQFHLEHSSETTIIQYSLESLHNEIHEILTILENNNIISHVIPSWLQETLSHSSYNSFTFERITALANSLQYSAPFTIRINPKHTTRSKVISILRDNSIQCEECSLSPHAIRILQRVDIRNSKLLLSGAIEVQDEASQLVGFASFTGNASKILDACAGAGGKSLHMASLYPNSLQITALDTEIHRLKEIPDRAKRAGFRSISTLLLPKNGEIPESFLRETATFDVVVVDAPCSGLGTSRRNPIALWKLTNDSLLRHSEKQLHILQTYSRFVKPGGILVYSTCSFHPTENEKVATDFLRISNDFIPSPLQPVFESQGVCVPTLSSTQNMLTLLPSEHHTDGFFVSRFKRIK